VCNAGSCSLHDNDACTFCYSNGCTCNEDLNFCVGCPSDYDCDSTCDPGQSAPSCTGSDNCPSVPNDQTDSYPPQGNLCGDACECEGNFDGDLDVDGKDVATIKADFGRSKLKNPCSNAAPCNGNFDCDLDVDGSNASSFKVDFGRSAMSRSCPNCVTVPWCVYP
jgi:hypothetical protein